MLIVRSEFNFDAIRENIENNKSSWFRDIYGVNILNEKDIKFFIQESNVNERHNFINDLIRWIKKISSHEKLMKCSFEISFIEENVKTDFIENNTKLPVLIKFALIKYVLINNNFYSYVGNIEDLNCVKV